MAGREALFDRDSSLLVARGLYLLRYESGGAGHDHPVALVKPAVGFEKIIQVMSAPGGVEGWLERPGAAVLVRAEDNGKIQIGVRRSGASGSLDAAFRLESVSVPPDDDRDRAAPRAITKGAPPHSPIGKSLSASGSNGALFLAHVSRRGDLLVGANEWAGGPDTPGRIEGLTILGLGRDGVQAEIQVLPGSRAATWSAWIGEGVFAGTRGRNQPLAGLRLRLTGGQAQRFILHAEALFLGSAIMTSRGRELEFLGVSGRDPLVGFRFEVCAERRATVRQAVSWVGQDEHPRVRIFRANAG